MMIRQGEVYLVDFGKKYNSELGKIRPAVVMQNNFLNKILPKAKHKSVLVIPLTSDDIVTEYKIKIDKRDKLQRDSFIIANWICTLDLEHILVEKGCLTTLSEDEFNYLKARVCDLM